MQHDNDCCKASTNLRSGKTMRLLCPFSILRIVEASCGVLLFHFAVSPSAHFQPRFSSFSTARFPCDGPLSGQPGKRSVSLQLSAPCMPRQGAPAGAKRAGNNSPLFMAGNHWKLGQALHCGAPALQWLATSTVAAPTKLASLAHTLHRNLVP